MIHARSFVRIDFAGGWTDIPSWRNSHSGAVLNTAISVPTYASAATSFEQLEVSKYGYPVVEHVQNRRICLYSADYDLYEEAGDIYQLEYNGKLDLLKAAIKWLKFENGVSIITRSGAPPGSGLGTSAAVGVCVLGALAKLNGNRFMPTEVAELAVALEVEELGLLSGKQDHYAAALGGINLFTFAGDRVAYFPQELSSTWIAELEKSTVLVYTGSSRLSSGVHAEVTSNLNEKAFVRLGQLALHAEAALQAEDLSALGAVVEENWRWQKELHPSVTNSDIDQLFESTKEFTLGGKACGAGGGGCCIFIAKQGQEHLLRKKLKELSVNVIEFQFEFQGLTVWEG